ncbi:class I SAM-dependent methyltransferase [Kitasatospora sp. GAS1066B]|uniref:class I SAM-dependent methyltransferase n=1 Tax=Kitasatospora sp. GAS1066B TaxID=3156271 RepID=UPI003515780F
MTDTWDTIADWYAQLLRNGSALNEFSRDILLDQLPDDPAGRRVLDVGCGEGIATRALAARGAHALGIDPSPRMIEHARAAEQRTPTGARSLVDDGCTLATVAAGSVDWVTAALSLNNVPDLPAALRAARRVLVPDGLLVFTIPHPCFEAPHAGWTDSTAEPGRPRRVVGDYHAEGFWRSADPHGVRRAGNQHRRLSGYLNALIAHGFAIEATAEPEPGPEVAAAQPRRAELPPFFVVRARSRAEQLG